MNTELQNYLNSICCGEILPLNRIEFTTGNAPTIEGLETILGFTLINPIKTGDVITFDNVGYHIPDSAFIYNSNLINYDVASGVTAGNSSFGFCSNLINGFDNLKDALNSTFAGCSSLIASFNNLLGAGNSCFSACILLNDGFNGCASLTSNFSSLNVIGDLSFQNCTSLTTLNFNNVDNFGTTTGFSNVFTGITGKTITVTAKTIHQTSNGGSLEGDLQYLADNNTVTFNWV